MLTSKNSLERRIGLSTVHDHLVHDGSSSSTGSCDCDTRSVAAECVDVSRNPLDCCALIEKTGVESAVLGNVSTAEEAIGAEAILDRHVDDVTGGLIHERITRRDALCITDRVA